MATDKQTAANRRNAQHWTGIDAKSEIIRYESPAEHAELAASFRARFCPATPEEVSLVDALIRFEWLSRRYNCADTAVWEHRLSQRDDSLAEVFPANSEKLSRAALLLNSVRRGFNATLKQLAQSQARRLSLPIAEPATTPETAPVPEPEPPQPPPSAPEAAPTGEAKPLNLKLVSFLKFPAPAPETSRPRPQITLPDPEFLPKAA